MVTNLQWPHFLFQRGRAFYQALKGRRLSAEVGFDPRLFHLPTETDIPERTLSFSLQQIPTKSIHLIQTLHNLKKRSS